jgi:hypothetical protein
MTKEVGLSLRDVGGLYEEVPVGDSFIKVKGIAARTALDIINRFPATMVQALQKGELNVSLLFKTAPEVINALIAAAVGKPGDEAAEADAAEVPLEIQMDILEAVGRLTFRSGFGPFVARIKALGASLNSANFGAEQATRSPQA